MHYCGRDRWGRFVVKRATSGNRLRRFLRGIWQWCKAHRHEPLESQSQALGSKLRGHYQYYGITHNMARLQTVFWAVCRAWRSWLNHRSQTRGATWDWFNRMLRRVRFPRPWLPHSVMRARLQGELF